MEGIGLANPNTCKERRMPQQEAVNSNERETKCIGCGEVATRPIDAFRLCEQCFNKTVNDDAAQSFHRNKINESEIEGKRMSEISVQEAMTAIDKLVEKHKV